MSWVDPVIIVGCLASAGFGAWRGLAKEALSLVTWLAAIWVAWRFAWLVEPLLGEWAGAPELKIWVARAVIFVLVFAAGGLIAWLIREVIRQTGLSGTDRVLGSVFGLVRGAIVVGLLAIALQLSGLDEDPWWREAKLRPYGDRIAEGIRFYAALGSRYIQEQDLV